MKGKKLIRFIPSYHPELDDLVEIWEVVKAEGNILYIKYIGRTTWYYFFNKEQYKGEYIVWNSFVDSKYMIVVITEGQKQENTWKERAKTAQERW